MSLIKSCLADLRMAITFQPTRCSRTKEPQPQLSKRGRLLYVFQATRNTNSSTHCVIKTKTLTLLCTDVKHQPYTLLRIFLILVVLALTLTSFWK